MYIIYILYFIKKYIYIYILSMSFKLYILYFIYIIFTYIIYIKYLLIMFIFPHFPCKTEQENNFYKHRFVD